MYILEYANYCQCLQVCLDAENAVQDKKSDVSPSKSPEKPKQEQSPEPSKQELVRTDFVRSNSTEPSKEFSRSNSVEERNVQVNNTTTKLSSRASSIENQSQIQRSQNSLNSSSLSINQEKENRVSAVINKIEKRFSRSSSDDDRPIIEARSEYSKSATDVHNISDVKSFVINKSSGDVNKISEDISRFSENVNKSSEAVNKNSESVNKSSDGVNKVSSEVNRIERRFSRSNSADEKRVQELGVRKEERRKEDRDSRRLQQNAVEIRPVTVS